MVLDQQREDYCTSTNKSDRLNLDEMQNSDVLKSFHKLNGIDISTSFTPPPTDLKPALQGSNVLSEKSLPLTPVPPLVSRPISSSSDTASRASRLLGKLRLADSISPRKTEEISVELAKDSITTNNKEASQPNPEKKVENLAIDDKAHTLNDKSRHRVYQAERRTAPSNKNSKESESKEAIRDSLPLIQEFAERLASNPLPPSASELEKATQRLAYWKQFRAEMQKKLKEKRSEIHSTRIKLERKVETEEKQYETASLYQSSNKISARAQINKSSTSFFPDIRNASPNLTVPPPSPDLSAAVATPPLLLNKFTTPTNPNHSTPIIDPNSVNSNNNPSSPSVSSSQYQSNLVRFLSSSSAATSHPSSKKERKPCAYPQFAMPTDPNTAKAMIVDMKEEMEMHWKRWKENKIEKKENSKVQDKMKRNMAVEETKSNIKSEEKRRGEKDENSNKPGKEKSELELMGGPEEKEQIVMPVAPRQMKNMSSKDESPQPNLKEEEKSIANTKGRRCPGVDTIKISAHTVPSATPSYSSIPISGSSVSQNPSGVPTPPVPLSVDGISDQRKPSAPKSTSGSSSSSIIKHPPPIPLSEIISTKLPIHSSQDSVRGDRIIQNDLSSKPKSHTILRTPISGSSSSSPSYPSRPYSSDYSAIKPLFETSTFFPSISNPSKSNLNSPQSGSSSSSVSCSSTSLPTKSRSSTSPPSLPSHRYPPSYFEERYSVSAAVYRTFAGLTIRQLHHHLTNHNVNTIGILEKDELIGLACAWYRARVEKEKEKEKKKRQEGDIKQSRATQRTPLSTTKSNQSQPTVHIKPAAAAAQTDSDREKDREKELIWFEINNKYKYLSIPTLLTTLSSPNFTSLQLPLPTPIYPTTLIPTASVTALYRKCMLRIHPDKIIVDTNNGNWREHIRATELFKFVTERWNDWKKKNNTK